MIFEESGNLVWFHPLPASIESTNLQVQQLGGQPVLTWWQGRIPPQGFGQGEEIIDNSRLPADRRACTPATATWRTCTNSTSPPQGTALLTVVQPDPVQPVVRWAGPSGGAVTDSLFQEIDLKTGLVRREWHSLDHVALATPTARRRAPSTVWPFDYFHLNSIDQLRQRPHADLGAQHLGAVRTEHDHRPGAGAHRRQALELEARRAAPRTAYQHDATRASQRRRSACSTTAACRRSTRSRAAILGRQPAGEDRQLLAQYEHPSPPLSSGSQGNMQIARKRQRVHRLGRRAVLLGIQLQRPAALRRPHARLLPVLPRVPLRMDGLARANPPAIAASRRTQAASDGLRELERRHAHGQLARAGRPDRAGS